MVSLMVQEIHKKKYDYDINSVLESYNPNFLYFKDYPEVWANKFYLRDHYAPFYSIVNPEIKNSKVVQNKLSNNRIDIPKCPVLRGISKAFWIYIVIKY